MRSPLLSRFLLIFALLFAQLGGLTHGISHALAEPAQSTDQSLPHDKLCDLCAAYAQIGSAIGGSGVSLAVSENCEAPHQSYFDPQTSETFPAFAARAPPHSA
ncbi:MAG: hypothetical protein EPN14_04330 [Gallionella sp.]|nr:MAG: hypothetical protein EPN14_04330 [Gallionella sp.]